MIYIHASAAQCFDASNKVDFKTLLKEKEPKAFRRTDNFIKLALLGAAHIKETATFDKSASLYLTSGEGNLAVFNRVRNHRFVENLLPKPIDFINLLSNTASFYVAQYLKIEGKNLFLSHQKFPVSSTLIMTQMEIETSNAKEIIVGALDEQIEPLSLSKKFLGHRDNTPLADAYSYIYFSSVKTDALASLSVDLMPLQKDELEKELQKKEDSALIAFSNTATLDSLLINKSLHVMDVSSFEFETKALYIIDVFLKSEATQITIIENAEDEYMLIEINKVL